MVLIGMKKIKNDFPEMTHKQRLSKAGQIWKSMSEQQKSVYSGEDTSKQQTEVQELNFVEHKEHYTTGITDLNKKSKFMN